MENRKIMVEVTEEEYEKIKAGILNEDIPTYEDVKKDVLEKMDFEDAKLLFEAHHEEFRKSLVDAELVGEIMNRSQKREKDTFVNDPVSLKGYSLLKGTLEHIKNFDLSDQENDKIIETQDTLSWSLKVY